MSNDLPLYEGKLIHQYDHRWSTFTLDGKLNDSTVVQKSNPSYTVRPRYWIEKGTVIKRLLEKKNEQVNKSNIERLPKWFMGFRDITNATNERTVLSCAIPFSAANNHYIIFDFVEERPAHEKLLLLANLNSMVLDYVARQKMGGTTLNFFLMNQFPVLPPDTYSMTDVAYIVPRVLELTYTANDMRPFAEDVIDSLKAIRENPRNPRLNSSSSIRDNSCNSWANSLIAAWPFPPYKFDPDRRATLRAELDARYAYLYGLSRDEFRYILDPADVMGPDYPSETFRVLKEGEIKKYGEYRTRRLVLEAWDKNEYTEKGDTVEKRKS